MKNFRQKKYRYESMRFDYYLNFVTFQGEGGGGGGVTPPIPIILLCSVSKKNMPVKAIIISRICFLFSLFLVKMAQGNFLLRENYLQLPLAHPYCCCCYYYYYHYYNKITTLKTSDSHVIIFIKMKYI